MRRELPRPEDATNWDDFLERIALERDSINDRRGAVPPLAWTALGALLLVTCLLLVSLAVGWQSGGQRWAWLPAVVPLAAVAWMLARALGRADRNQARLRELDQLELGWKSHLQHSRF